MITPVILAVDDRSENLFIIEQIVTQCLGGARLLKALSAEEGLKLAQDHPVDVAILDVQMPTMDGIEMSRKLKENPRTKDIAIVLLTAHMATPELKARGLEAGADDFIAKPIDVMEFTARIRVMLRIKEGEKALKNRKEVLEATVTERTLSLARANRALKMHSACNKAIVHTRSESELLTIICDTLSTTGGFPLCRVDYLDALAPSGTCRALSSSLDLPPLTHHEDRSKPSAFDHYCSKVVTDRRPLVLRNLQVREEKDDLTADAMHYKYRTLAILPIVTDHGPVGTLSVGASGQNACDDAEIGLLSEIVEDLAFGIQTLRLYDQQAKTEKSLQESRETMRALLNSPPDFAYLLELDGTILALNDNAARIFNRTADDLIGKNVFDLLPSWISEYRRKKMALAAGLKKPYRFEDETRRRRFSHNLFPIFNEQGVLYRMSIFTRDITREKQLENESRRLTAAIEQSPESVIITDKNGVIQYVNPGFEKTTGYTREEAIGKNPRFLQSGKHSRQFYGDMWKILSEGRIWKGELINRRKDGSLIEEGASISPVKDDFGNVIHYVAVKLDITEQKKMGRQIRQGQKMEAIGTLAGGIAHDFNNILSAIMGYTEITISALPPDSKLNTYLSKILAASKRAADLVNQILMFSRKSDTEMRPLKVKSVVKEAAELLRASLPSTIDIVQKIESDSYILGDTTQFHQVVMNLCANSGYAMKEKGGVLTLELEDIHPPYSETVERLIASSRESENEPPPFWVQLKVIDTGHGIEKKNLKRLFDPFFTTKATGEGTGMGLSVVHGILESHKATIQVESERGKGTEVTVLFPAMKRQNLTAADFMLTVKKGSETVLLVDDEHALVDVNSRNLESLGYIVTARTSPDEALELFKRAPDAFDIVITDLTMPGMTGDVLAEKILAVRPDIPILLCTGFSTPETEKRAETIGIRRIINKPLTTSKFSEAIRSVLDRR
jgi:PAS domain S-box-containing protein